MCMCEPRCSPHPIDQAIATMQARRRARTWPPVTLQEFAALSRDELQALAMEIGVNAAAVATGAIDADALAADAVDEILDEVIEGSLTLRQALRVLLAALANKASGGGTTTVTFRDLADSKARITATVDANGNRTAVTLDGS